MPKENEKLIIGIDGGGTKTVGALANLDGKILKKIKGPSSNPNKIGFKDAISNLKTLIFQLSKNKEKNILLAFLGLAGGLERDKEKKEKIKKALQKDFKFPIFVEGDQKIAFLAQSSKEDGVLIIAGTGSISMGWREEKEVVCGGWDWLLGDQGSGFWIGKKAIEMVLKKIDGREKIKTNLDKILKSKLKIEKEKDFYQKFYQKDFVEKIASVSKLVDFGAKKGDILARKILIEAAKELAKMGIATIKKLKFEKEKFPVVLVGGTFNSKFVFERVKKEIKKVAKKAKIILSKKEPVIGALKMAQKIAKNYVSFRH